MDFDIDFKVSGVRYRAIGSYDSRHVVDDFSHEFGIEKSSHNEVDSFDVEELFIIDDEGDEIATVFTKEIEEVIKEKLQEYVN